MFVQHQIFFMQKSDYAEMQPYDPAILTGYGSSSPGLLYGDACKKAQFWDTQTSSESTRCLCLMHMKLRNVWLTDQRVHRREKTIFIFFPIQWLAAALLFRQENSLLVRIRTHQQRFRKQYINRVLNVLPIIHDQRKRFLQKHMNRDLNRFSYKITI